MTDAEKHAIAAVMVGQIDASRAEFGTDSGVSTTH